jgi:DNA-binding transcriptional ArsR family regulator
VLDKLLGSRLRARLIGWLFTHPDERFYVRQLTDILGEDSTNVSRELVRLETLGILLSERDGRQKYYRANPSSSIFDELKALAAKTTGLVDALRSALSDHAGEIQTAFVYGSFARQEETAASDVDVMIIGDVDPLALQTSVTLAEAKLRREINYVLYSSREYKKRRREKAPFLVGVLAGAKLMLMGSLDDD